MRSKYALLVSFVESQKDVQVKFRDDPGPPVGPGKLEQVSLAGAEYFKLTAPAIIAGHGNKPQQIMLPILFSEDDVLWLTEGPINSAGDKLITELPSRKSPGGLHIG